jgi:hypothetical protein
VIMEKSPRMQRLSVICDRENRAEAVYVTDYAVTMQRCLYYSTEDTTDNVGVGYNTDG